jgi:hypothetical protein
MHLQTVLCCVVLCYVMLCYSYVYGINFVTILKSNINVI